MAALAEGGSGKVVTVQQAYLNGVDVVIRRHPANKMPPIYPVRWPIASQVPLLWNCTSAARNLKMALKKGALDAVESMDYMIKYDAEHIPAETRIHYVITKRGKPNVVPRFCGKYITMCAIPTGR